MNDLQAMALERAADDIREARRIFAEIGSWRDPPLTEAQRCDMTVKANGHLDAAWGWIKAVLNNEDDT